ncbi:MAG: hypothetical protein L0H42_12255, partial [Yaniella sp.]|nr:hypothetical protein [Yaniella sp.]MDN5819070.1 hypothetical protein [Yaniella sp.]
MITSSYPIASKNRGRRVVLASLASATLALTGCTAVTDPALQQTDTAALTGHEASRAGGTLEYGHLQEPNCIFGGWIQENFTARQVL